MTFDRLAKVSTSYRRRFQDLRDAAAAGVNYLVLAAVPAHKEGTLSLVKKRDAVIIAIDPAFALLLGPCRLYVEL